MKDNVCKWKYDAYQNCYETDCDNAFQFTEGNVSDNGVKFCPYCGKIIEEEI